VLLCVPNMARLACLNFIRLVLWCLSTASLLGAAPQVGELIRLNRGETLMLDGKRLASAAKGQEFTIIKREPGTAYLGYLKEDGKWVSATVPFEAVEASPSMGWQDLHRAFQAFRDQRYDEMRTFLNRAAQDKEQQAMVNALTARITGATNAAVQAGNSAPAAQQALLNTVQTLRDTAAQLAEAGRISLAVALDEGTDRLAAPGLGAKTPPSKINRAELAARAALVERSYIHARQAIGARKLMDAKKAIEEGLRAEAAHPGLKAFQPNVKRGIDDAEELYETANKMRRFEKGAVHALSAIDDGLKLCADHPRLRTLRTEMSAQFEERTSPQVTPAFLSAAKVTTAREILDEGRTLYTNRCSECHDLEMLDSRSLGGWEKTVSGMSRRANLTAAEKARIMDYLAAALKVVEE
jgi:hypothetical protein